MSPAGRSGEEERRRLVGRVRLFQARRERDRPEAGDEDVGVARRLGSSAPLLLHHRRRRAVRGRTSGAVALRFDGLIPTQALLQHLHEIDHVGGTNRRGRFVGNLFVLRFLLDDLEDRVPIFIAVFLPAPMEPTCSR